MNDFFDPTLLPELVQTKMPFGKYEGIKVCHLPEAYLLWFKNKGFPAGKLGKLLSLMYEIKLNGLEYLLQPLLSELNSHKPEQ